MSDSFETKKPICNICHAVITEVSGGPEYRGGSVAHMMPSACAIELIDVRNRYHQALIMIERVARENQNVHPGLAVIIMQAVRKVLDPSKERQEA